MIIDTSKEGGINTTVAGFYNVQVVNEQDEVISDYGWNKNLILNSGMGQISASYLASLTEHAVIGSGSRANKITSSNSTITQSGNIITLWPEVGGLQNFSSSVISGSEVHYSSSLQPGDVIVYANASESMVTSIDTIGGLTASVNTSYTIESGSNQTFTIWKTSQTGLHKQKSITGTYYTLTGGCGTTDSTGSNGIPNVRTFRRMYEFPLETAGVTYTEAGVKWTANNQLFSRMVLSPPVFVDVGYKLRLTHHFRIVVTPDLPHYFTASISGWPVAPSTDTICTESIQRFATSIVESSGITSTIYNQNGQTYSVIYDPFFSYNTIPTLAFASSDTQSLAPFGSSVTRGQIGGVSGNTTLIYTNEYTIYKRVIFDINSIADAYTASIYTIGIGDYYPINGTVPWDKQYNPYTIRFNQPQYKDNTQELTLVWKYTWARVLGE